MQETKGTHALKPDLPGLYAAWGDPVEPLEKHGGRADEDHDEEHEHVECDDAHPPPDLIRGQVLPIDVARTRRDPSVVVHKYIQIKLYLIRTRQ